MANCVIEEAALSRRGSKVSEILRPLSGTRSGPARVSISEAGSIVIATYTGSKPAGTAYRDWRFSTYVPSFYGMYFERWLPADVKHRAWQMDRAYLSVFRLDRFSRSEEEIVAVHCDPNEADATHLRYKQGPHLHVTVAEHPIPHSHIALSLAVLDSLLSSVDRMTEAIAQSVEMVNSQILGMYQHVGRLKRVVRAE